MTGCSLLSDRCQQEWQIIQFAKFPFGFVLPDVTVRGDLVCSSGCAPPGDLFWKQNQFVTLFPTEKYLVLQVVHFKMKFGEQIFLKTPLFA